MEHSCETCKWNNECASNEHCSWCGHHQDNWSPDDDTITAPLYKRIAELEKENKKLKEELQTIYEDEAGIDI